MKVPAKKGQKPTPWRTLIVWVPALVWTALVLVSFSMHWRWAADDHAGRVQRTLGEHLIEDALAHGLMGALGLGGFLWILRKARASMEATAAVEEKFRAVFDNAKDAMFILDENLRFVDVNRAACEGLQYTREELLGLTPKDIESTEQAAYVEERAAKIKRQDSLLFESAHRRRDGQIIPVEVSVQQITFRGKRLMFSICRSLEDRKRNEAERDRLFKLSEEKQYWLTESQRVARLGSYAFDFATGRWKGSEVLDEIFGLSPAAEHSAEDWVRLLHPADRERMTRYFKETAVREGRFNQDYRIVRQTDKAERWVQGLGSIEFSASGEPVRMFGTIQDITERKHLEERLREAQKLEAIGQLAGGIAHDFNNILAASMMSLGLIRANPAHRSFPEQIHTCLSELEAANTRAASLTRQLLMFSRRSLMNMRPVDLNEAVINLLNMLRRLLGENINIEFIAGCPQARVQADESMIDQVVVNLVVNARDAMPKGGRLAISTSRVEIGPDEANGNNDRRTGSFVRLSVIDTGCGMDEVTAGRIFEPFFTTKPVGKGTGLGLSTVHGIVSQHNGWVEVKSALGKGSEFSVFLPALAAIPNTNVTRQLPRRDLRGEGVVLLVEDETAVRQITAAGLRQLGYEVLEAAHPEEALSVWDRQPRIDLLFSDMVMPGKMTGLDLARRLRERKAGLKVIISTGYSSEIIEHGALEKSNIVLLPKPYEVSRLGEVVQELLKSA